jgi:hypothetical protein
MERKYSNVYMFGLAHMFYRSYVTYRLYFDLQQDGTSLLLPRVCVPTLEVLIILIFVNLLG